MHQLLLETAVLLIFVYKDIRIFSLLSINWIVPNYQVLYQIIYEMVLECIGLYVN